MKCPFCAEEIRDEAVICRFCQRSLQPATVGAVASSRDQSPAPPPPAPSYPTGPSWAGPPVAPRTNSKAIVSLILALFWFAGLGSLAAIVLGVMAKRQIDASNGTETGRGIAIAGTVLGVLGVLSAALMVAMLAVGLVGAASQMEAAAKAEAHSALRTAAIEQEMAYTASGSYSHNALPMDESVPLTVVRADTTGYCIEAAAVDGRVFHLDSVGGTPTDGPCR